ncbi:MAG: class I SAM-dependent methyltransferase [Cyclobacteriaceae bacterium]|nr:class I SAM-dependent methyltransferase [Cyclobacteriaceae bacterium]
MQACPLCNNSLSGNLLQSADLRRHRLCNHCHLIATVPTFHATSEQEIQRYLTHNNSIQNSDYVAFLNRILSPVLPMLTDHMHLLDYGCGPLPVLSELLASKGFSCDNYDIYFFQDGIQKHNYDVIFASECFEHFRHPLSEIQKITNLLANDGILAIMTERYTDLQRFKNWYYARDITHIAFYHKKTIEYICSQFKLDCIYDDGKRVCLLQKSHSKTAKLPEVSVPA